MNRKKGLLCCILLVSASICSYAQSSIDESLITETITVDTSLSISSTNFHTISEAADYLDANKTQNIKLSIASGTYREGSIVLNYRTGITVIEGSSPGEVIITGADIWTGWNDDGSGNYWKTWSPNWGLANYDSNYDIKDDLGRRSEIVLLNDERLLQVSDKAGLVDNSFTVDETDNRLWIRLENGADPNSGGQKVEVSQRHNAFYFHETHNLVLRNLIVENYANGRQHGGNDRYAVALLGESKTELNEQLLIENCEFRGNNSSGMTLKYVSNMTIQNTKFIDNGSAGTGLSRFRYAHIENCDFNDNNWRIGGYGIFSGWGPAGTKLFMFGDVTIHNCRFNNNNSPGLWLDTGGENVTVTNCEVVNNIGGAGIYVEANYGPILIDNCIVKNNAWEDSAEMVNQGGILIAESRDITITNCLIEDNHHFAIGIRTRFRQEGDPIFWPQGYWSETYFDGYVEDITIQNNRLKGKYVKGKYEFGWYADTHRHGGLVMMTTHGNTDEYQAQFLPTLNIDNNSYYHETRSTVFSTGTGYGFDRISLEDWKALGNYGLDTNSVWEEVYTGNAGNIDGSTTIDFSNGYSDGDLDSNSEWSAESSWVVDTAAGTVTTGTDNEVAIYQDPVVLADGETYSFSLEFQFNGSFSNPSGFSPYALLAGLTEQSNAADGHLNIGNDDGMDGSIQFNAETGETRLLIDYYRHPTALPSYQSGDLLKFEYSITAGANSVETEYTVSITNLTGDPQNTISLTEVGVSSSFYEKLVGSGVYAFFQNVHPGRFGTGISEIQVNSFTYAISSSDASSGGSGSSGDNVTIDFSNGYSDGDLDSNSEWSAESSWVVDTAAGTVTTGTDNEVAIYQDPVVLADGETYSFSLEFQFNGSFSNPSGFSPYALLAGLTEQSNAADGHLNIGNDDGMDGSIQFQAETGETRLLIDYYRHPTTLPSYQSGDLLKFEYSITAGANALDTEYTVSITNLTQDSQNTISLTEVGVSSSFYDKLVGSGVYAFFQNVHPGRFGTGISELQVNSFTYTGGATPSPTSGPLNDETGWSAESSWMINSNPLSFTTDTDNEIAIDQEPVILATGDTFSFNLDLQFNGSFANPNGGSPYALLAGLTGQSNATDGHLNKGNDDGMDGSIQFVNNSGEIRLQINYSRASSDLPAYETGDELYGATHLEL